MQVRRLCDIFVFILSLKVTKHPWQSMKSRYLRLANDLNERFKFCQMMKAKSKGSFSSFLFTILISLIVLCKYINYN